DAAIPPMGQPELLERGGSVDQDRVDPAPITAGLALVAPGAQALVVAAQRVDVGGDLDRLAALGVEQPEVAVERRANLLGRGDMQDGDLEWARRERAERILPSGIHQVGAKQ